MKPFSKEISSTNAAHTSEPCEIKWAANLAIDTSWTWAAVPSPVDVPSADVDATANTLTKEGHGLSTGHVVRLTISGGGTLPAPLAVATDYFVIRIDADTFKLATNRANADAGTAIDLEDQGTALETVTATVQANAGSVTLEYCPDVELSATSVWRTLAAIDIDNATSPDAFRLTSNYYHWIRCTVALPSGFLSAFKCEAFGKGL